MRKKWTLSAEAREALLEQAEALAVKIVAEGADAEDAADIVGAVVETALEMAGAPDLAAELGGKLAERIVEALRPDPEKLMERAMAAMREGNAKKSQRLMAKAERVLARQAEE